MNRFRLAPVLLAISTSVAASAAVDPALLDLAPPGAKVLVGIDVQRVLSSPFGQFLFAQTTGQNAGLLRFTEATGFDLRRDLSEVLLAGSPAPGTGDQTGVVLARGTFPIDNLLSLTAAIHGKSVNYNGVPLITGPEQRAWAIALLDPSTVAAGSESAVKDVIDRRAAQVAFSGPFAEKVRMASASGDAWVAAVELLAGVPKTDAPGSGLFKAILESSAGLRFDASGLTLAAEALTHSESEAQGLVTALKFAAGMVKGPPAAVFQGAQFTSSGPVTHVTLTVAEQDLERMFALPPQGRAAR